MSESIHVPVLLKEVTEYLQAEKEGSYLDCTFGGGGHTRALLDANRSNLVTSLDRDSRAIARGREKFAGYGERLKLVHAPFSLASMVLNDTKFEGILADLGLSTDQLKEGRGFSFKDDDSLDMRMDETIGTSAQELINEVSEKDLFKILKEGGVGSEARAVTQAIVKSRPIKSASALATTVNQASRGRTNKTKINPSTVVFQAIRIAVNDEYREIESLLDSLPNLMKPKGRAAFITFHSAEDKLVTSRFRDWEGRDNAPPSWEPVATSGIGRLVTRKPVVPEEAEVARNPAARSARLRVFEFN